MSQTIWQRYGRSVSVAANYALHWLEMTGWNAHRSLLCQNIVCYEGAFHMEKHKIYQLFFSPLAVGLNDDLGLRNVLAKLTIKS